MEIYILIGWITLNCTADCLSSNKVVDAIWIVPAHFTCQHTCQATITCNDGYKNRTTKVSQCVTSIITFC